MNKHIYLLVTGFLMICLGLGCEKGSDAGQPVMHMSERVKIKRPEAPAPVAVKAEEVPVPKTPVIAATEESATEPPEPGKILVVQTESGSIQKMAVSPAPLPGAVSPPVTESPSAVVAPTAPEPMEQTAQIPSKHAEASDLIGEKQALFGDQEKYYVRKGRIDPFEPFLHKPEPKAAEIQTPEVQRRTPRTPLERIAIGQLKLTAVMRLTNDDLKMAMVEDNNGKGYIVRKGTYIGENGGRVSDIEENKVVVEETYNDVFGKTAVRQIELKLQKQPGE